MPDFTGKFAGYRVAIIAFREDPLFCDKTGVSFGLLVIPLDIGA